MLLVSEDQGHDVSALSAANRRKGSAFLAFGIIGRGSEIGGGAVEHVALVIYVSNATKVPRGRCRVFSVNCADTRIVTVAEVDGGTVTLRNVIGRTLEAVQDGDVGVVQATVLVKGNVTVVGPESIRRVGRLGVVGAIVEDP